MESLTKKRIESLDLLKGLVMVIMAIDHVRDYFHLSAYLYDPTDPAQTSIPIFFTRWITHFCAPAFCLLAGVSAYLVGRRKTKKELSSFLFKRGLWLVIMELTIVDIGWFFDLQFGNLILAVIWSLGISMILLSVLIYLNRTALLIFSCVVIFGHNLLDTIHFPGNFFWSMLHDPATFQLSPNTILNVYYPIIPWFAVMSLGYCLGSLYDKSFDINKRKKILNLIGISSLLLFIILRWINIYGDLFKWVHLDTTAKITMEILNPNKYPPSLLYLLMTLGGAFLFLANTEQLKGKAVNFFSTFGRVPFFYYILHLFLIHFAAMLFAQLSGYGWHSMILKSWVSETPALSGFGYRLWVVYAVWMGIILLLYPLCKKFDVYKSQRKDKWWLSYL